MPCVHVPAETHVGLLLSLLGPFARDRELGAARHKIERARRARRTVPARVLIAHDAALLVVALEAVQLAADTT